MGTPPASAGDASEASSGASANKPLSLVLLSGAVLSGAALSGELPSFPLPPSEEAA